MSSNSPLDLAEQLLAARNGSTVALGNVLNECHTDLLLLARRQLGSDLRAKSGASDLVQETFLEAQRQFRQFHGVSAEELRAWLCCLLRHRAAKIGRRFRTTAKRRLSCEIPAGELAAPTGSPSYQASTDEQLCLLRGAIAHLADDYRRVTVLRYEQGLTFEEIGQLMGRSADAARMLWTRAVEALKDELRSA